MKKTPNVSPFTRRRLTALLACVALAVGTAAAAALAGGYKPPVSQAVLRGDAPAEQLETELVTITSTGFDPAEVTRPQGSFILEVDNRGGFEELVLQLDALRGAREREARVPRTALDWRDRLDLRPGVYVLREAGHPGWECRITITPR